MKYTGRLAPACWSLLKACLCRELSLRQIPFECQVHLLVSYKGVRVDCGYRLDILVDNIVPVELKAVEQLLPVHEAQVLSYLRLDGWQVGLLINFHLPILRQGIKRIVLGLSET